MNLKNLCLLASFAAMTGFFSCKTEEKKEGSEASPVLSNNDLSNARIIDLGFPVKDTLIAIDSGNAGAGQTQEFNTDSSSVRHMPGAEDNTDWYKITAAGDTAISFTVKPKDAASELDFVLFRSSGETVSADLAAGKVNALRSNFSKTSGDGSTGLACDSRLGYHGSDEGSMSKAFVIRAGQTYYLVVNSPVARSSGYEISFRACAPGEGGLADFEGDVNNPEAESGSSAGDVEGKDGVNTGDKTSSTGSDNTSGKSGLSGGNNGSGTSGKSSGNNNSGNAGNSGLSGGKNANGTSGKSSGIDKSGNAGNSGLSGGKNASGTSGKNSGNNKSGNAANSGLSGGKNASGTSGKSSGNNKSGNAGKSGSGKTEKVSEYEVGGQETLYSIAFKMGMTVEELMELNGLTDTNIFPGQKLKVVKRELSQKAIEEKMAKSKLIKPSPPKPGSTTDPKEVARIKAEKAAAEEARKKAIADELKAKAAAANAAKGGSDKTGGADVTKGAGQGSDADPMKTKSGTEALSGRNPNFNPTPNFPVNNPKVNKGVETSNSLAPADKSFYVYCNVTSGVNRNPVAGVLQVVDLKKKDLVYNVQANRTQAVPLFNAGGKQKLLICDIFGYKKQDFDLNLDNIINDSTAQQVQIVDDTIVINFELRRLEKGDIAVAYNIFFYDDASVMLPKSTYELDQLLELMMENKKIKVKIHGHTNTSKLGKILYLDKGDKTFFRLTAKNKEMFGPAKMLSKKRAETIKMYLESKRITDDRIETEGHGGSQMLYPNTHPLAFKNKRVEVEILEDK